MERVLKLNINSDAIRAKLRKVDKALETTQRKGMNTAQMIGKSFKGLGSSIFSLKGALVGLIGAAGLGALTKSFIQASATTEGYRTRLTVLLGSVEEGNRLFDDMADYASKVPFEYEKVMQASTQLAGVMKGGVDEIKQWMPLIGDLAATSGLTIQQTTEQVARMYSSGAQSAELFKERGINAMLGFQNGVTYSAEETREMLMNAWEAPTSRFQGATELLAKNWDGVMSMMADKWFAFKNAIMDAGLMDYFKAIAMTIDQYMGKGLESSKKNAKAWSDYIIDSINSVIKGFAYAADGAAFIGRAFDGAAWVVAKASEVIIQTIYQIAEGWRLLSNLIPGVNIAPLDSLHNVLKAIQKTTKDIATDLTTAANAPTYASYVDDFAAGVKGNVGNLEAARAEQELKGEPAGPGYKTVENTSGPTDKENEMLQSKVDQLEQSLLSEEQRIAESFERRSFMVEEAFQNGLITDMTRQELTLGLEQQMEDKKTAIAEAGAKDRQQVMQGTLSSTASALGSLSQLLTSAGKKQSTASKIFAKASIITSTAVAIMKAWELPWPANLAAAAAAGLAGATQLAKVGAGGGGGTSSSATNPVSSNPGLAATPIATPTNVVQPRGETLIQFTGNVYGWDDSVVDDLALRLGEAIDDRDVRIISPDSRQAQDLQTGT